MTFANGRTGGRGTPLLRYAEMIVFKLPVRKRGAFCSIAAYPHHVNLGFYFGAELPDPHSALKGNGKKMRHIRFDSPNDLRHR